MIINKKLTAVVVLTVYVFLQAPTDVAAAGIKQIQALIAEERLEEALSLTNEELKRGNVDVNYRFLKGLILIRLNRLEQAVDVFTGITESHPELPEPYNNLAVIHAAMGDLDEARQALQQAINTHPSYATAHENIGDIYAKLASQAYNQALQLDQANATAKAKLSLIKDLFSVPEPERETALAEAIDEAPPPRKQKEQPESSTVTATSDGTDSRKEATAAELKPEEEIIESVRAAVSDWAGDWSSQDVEAYLTRYGEDFTPPAGQTLADWKRERTERLNRPRFIRVDISELRVELLGKDYAQATFMQKYQSDTYSDLVTKLLLFKRKNDRWLIVQEATK